MKKTILISMSALAIAALVASCSKNTNNNTGGGGQGGGEDVVAPITIDGVFDDWKALKAGTYAVAELPDDEVQYPNLLKMMAVADKEQVYLYFEYQLAEDQTQAPITIEFDSDDDPSTGFTDWLWKDAGWSCAIESSAGFVGPTSYKKITDFRLIKMMDGYDGQARSWEPKNWSDLTAKGVKNRGVKDEDIFTFEINVPRELIGAQKKGTMRVAAYVENVLESWTTCGVLPIDEGAGATEMLEVTLP